MIHVEELTKYYGAHAAIRSLNFTIDKGEVIGFLGLNGAGKSTTLKVLGCVLLQTSGRVLIDGFDVTKEPHEIRKRIGFLPDTPPLYDEMTVSGYLAFVAKLRQVPDAQVSARVDDVLKKCALIDRKDDPIFSLSHGYRQRVGLAQALVHNPKLLILDEPTGGLDPVQIVEMRELIRGLKGEHTILVSSHILSEISQICDRYLVIQQGEIVAQGTEAQLSSQLGGGASIEVDVREADGVKAQGLVQGLESVSAVSVEPSAEAGMARLRLTAAAEIRTQLLKSLAQANVEVFRLEKTATKLERIFLQLAHGKEA
jgi:ABC-2 type transport system ATP-binding protein